MAQFGFLPTDTILQLREHTEALSIVQIPTYLFTKLSFE
jgi:hypothetical protein